MNPTFPVTVVRGLYQVCLAARDLYSNLFSHKRDQFGDGGSGNEMWCLLRTFRRSLNLDAAEERIIVT
jgi:hypothetical protein